MKVFKCGILMLCVGLIAANALDSEEQYLENKRRQLEIQTREFNEARQALEAYKASFDALQKQKMDALVRKEADINATLAKIEQTRQQNERILQQNEASLKSIDAKSEGRVREIYAQMKDSAVAEVLSTMDANEASKILMSLDSKKISNIMAKMEAAKASELTLLIKNLEKNSITNENKETAANLSENSANLNTENAENPTNSALNSSENLDENTTNTETDQI